MDGREVEYPIKVTCTGEGVAKGSACCFDVGVIAQVEAICGSEPAEAFRRASVVTRCVARGCQWGLWGGREDGSEACFSVEDSVEVLCGGVVVGVKENFPQACFDVEEVVEGVGQGVLVLGEPVVRGLVLGVGIRVAGHCSSSRALR
ncbi:hypothetical protein CTZ27_24940 [Streptomyces griseocarneus]|nr:hypothetical protein CTZ27_24940 [Streptomyces griseocarneus]